MRRGTLRSATISIGLILFTFFILRLLSQPKEEEEEQVVKTKPRVVNKNSNEKFMSFFPHGNFATQHEAVRNALRIALETNRTLILPQLRLGKNRDWAPFPILAKHYESQEKAILKIACERKERNWMTQFQPCVELNEWIELPWSSFYNLDRLRKEFKLRIIERIYDHGWGSNDKLTPFIGEEEVLVVDPTSFPSNGSDWESMGQEIVKSSISSSEGLFSRFFSVKKNEEKESLKLKSGLKNVIRLEDLMGIKEKYIQFGSLVYGLRFLTSLSPQQTALQQGLKNSGIFLVPDGFYALNQVSQAIVETLGGEKKFNSIQLSFEQLVMTELINQMNMKRENAVIEGQEFKDDTKFSFEDGRAYGGKELLDQLSSKGQSELMSAVVRELSGEMPINQAISAGLPLKDSLLRELINNKQHQVNNSIQNRHKLLLACIDYRKAVDARYPIYYLSNDVYNDDIYAHLELFGPMIKAFPCTFTKHDMYSWNKIDKDWLKKVSLFRDPEVDYEKLISPIIDILVASKGYSFFEVPVTKLTRLLSWN